MNAEAKGKAVAADRHSYARRAWDFGRAKDAWQRFTASPAGNFVIRHFEKIMMPVVAIAVYLLWKWIIRLGDYPPYILPPPEMVWRKLLIVVEDGSLWQHAQYTLLESILGFLAALVFGTSVGYVLAKSRFLEKLFSPYIVGSRGVPVIAIAPILVIWFGFGLPSKVFVSFFIVFFPMLVNTIVGIREVNADQRELMRSYQASRWQMFKLLEIPSALPVLLGGIKVGITGSIMGAVVGEFVGADRGLGFVVNLSKGIFDTALSFVAIAALAVMSFMLYSSVWVLEIILLKGRRGHASE